MHDDSLVREQVEVEVEVGFRYDGFERSPAPPVTLQMFSNFGSINMFSSDRNDTTLSNHSMYFMPFDVFVKAPFRYPSFVLPFSVARYFESVP